MEKDESHAGKWGWLAVGAFVVAFDVLSPETMSSAMDRALEHPIGKFAAIGGVAVTGAHLLNLFEHFGVEQLDPFVQSFKALDRIRDAVRQ